MMVHIIKVNRNSDTKEYILLYGGNIQHIYGADSIEIYCDETDDVYKPFDVEKEECL